MILSSHYVIKDILHTLERGDIDEIRRACDKYASRYRYDEAFVGICNMLKESEELSERQQQEALTKLQELLSVRKIDSAGGTGLWYTDRRKLNR